MKNKEQNDWFFEGRRHQDGKSARKNAQDTPPVSQPVTGDEK